MGIGKYAIVNLLDKWVEVYRDPGARGYKEKRTVGLKESLTPLALPNVTLKVREILSAARLLQNMSQSRALNRTINRYSNLE